MRRFWLLLILLAPLAPFAASASAAEDAPVVRAAISRLREAVAPAAGQPSHRMLVALRQLRDPALRPVFEALAASESPVAQVHGQLGLAELNDPPGLTLGQLARLTDPAVQAQVVAAAMDDELLPDAAIGEMLAWDDLDTGVRLLLLQTLVARGDIDDPAPMHEALDSRRLARRSLAGLLLHQLGDPAGVRVLAELDRSDAPQRDAVRAMLLRTAARHELGRAATWAHAAATDEDAPAGLKRLALEVALRLGEPRAAERWREAFAAAGDDLLERRRLAMIALEVAPWVRPGLFSPLIESGEDFERQVGEAGRAVAQASPHAAEAVGRLVRTGHAGATQWAVGWSAKRADPAGARAVARVVIEQAEAGPRAGRMDRLEFAMQAAAVLARRDPDGAVELLEPLLTEGGTDADLTRVILLGLTQAEQENQWRWVAGLPRLPRLADEQLALLFRARSGRALSQRQLRDLGLIVRGGGEVPPPLRLQAAWLYLERTGRAGRATEQLFRP
ncbi:MAG: hypothetical protein ACLFV3_01760 [Phycisphaeraceae bacterium]